MTRKKQAKRNKPKTIIANDPNDQKGALKTIGGSQSDHWNNVLANQAVNALWMKHFDDETIDRQLAAVVAGLEGHLDRFVVALDRLEFGIQVVLVDLLDIFADADGAQFADDRLSLEKENPFDQLLGVAHLHDGALQTHL